MPRRIDDCTFEQSAWLCHKFDNARAVAGELDALETMEEELVGITRARW